MHRRLRARVNYSSRRLSRLEHLESRSLLAGDVAISQVGNNLILTGDAEANDIVITASSTVPGRIEISSGTDTTTLNGGAGSLEFDLIGDLRIYLGDGADVLAMIGNTSGNALVPEDLIVDLDSGDNGFRIEGGFAIAQDLLYTGGNNNNALNVWDVAIGRNLRVTSGAGGHVSVFNAVDVSGDLRVSHTAPSGNVLFLGGSVDGPVVINQGDALNPGSSSTFLFAGDFGGNVSINHTAGSNMTTFGGGVDPLVIAGNLTLNNGGLYSLVDFSSASVAGNVTITNGPGYSQINVGYDFLPTVVIGGTARFTSSNGDAVVTVDNANIGVDLIVQTGTPDTLANEIYLGRDAAVVVGRDVRVLGGSGTDLVEADDIEARDLIFNLGVGANTLNVNGSNANRDLLLNDGDDLGLIQAVNIVDADVDGDVRLSSAAGTGSFEANVDGSTIDGQLRLSRAAGNGSYRVGVVSPNTIGGDLKIITGVGFDLVDLRQTSARDVILTVGDGATDISLVGIAAARDLTVTQGEDGAAGDGGANSLNVRIDESDIGRDLRVKTGAITGVATTRIRATDVVGTATFISGYGNSVLNIGDVDAEGAIADCHIGENVTATSPGGGQTLNFRGGSIGGNLTVNGGDIANLTSLNNAHIVGNVHLSGAFGSNLVFLTDTTIDGNLTTNYGTSGSNFTQIFGGTVGGNVVLRGGLSSNMALIGAVGLPVTTIHGRLDIGSAGLFGGASVANAIIDGNLLFSNGDGDSSLSLGQSGGGTVIVGGLVRVTTGAGNASVQAYELAVASDFIVNLGDTSSQSSVNLGSSGPVAVGRDLTINFGNGTALATIANTTVTRNLKITSQNGADTILIDGASVGGNATIDTGSNDDIVSLGATQTTDLSHGSTAVRTGANNDTVTVGSNTLLRFTPTPNFLFDGGTDTDTIDLYFAVTGSLASKVKNFETIT